MPPRCFLLRVLPRARAWDKSAFFRLDDGPFLFFERAFGTRRTRCENGDFEYILNEEKHFLTQIESTNSTISERGGDDASHNHTNYNTRARRCKDSLFLSLFHAADFSLEANSGSFSTTSFSLASCSFCAIFAKLYQKKPTKTMPYPIASTTVTTS